MKETFIIRTEWKEAILDLEPAEQAMILQNLFHYHSEGEENLINLNNQNNKSVKLVWKLIEPNLERNISNYDRRKETSAQNGKKGGRPEKNLNNLNKPNEKPIEIEKPIESLNDSVSVSVSDSVSVIVSDYVFEKEEKEKVENFENEIPEFVEENRKNIAPAEGGRPERNSENLMADILQNEICQKKATEAGIQEQDYENTVKEFVGEVFGLGKNKNWKNIIDARQHFINWTFKKQEYRGKSHTSTAQGRSIVERQAAHSTTSISPDGTLLRISGNGVSTFAG